MASGKVSARTRKAAKQSPAGKTPAISSAPAPDDAAPDTPDSRDEDQESRDESGKRGRLAASDDTDTGLGDGADDTGDAEDDSDLGYSAADRREFGAMNTAAIAGITGLIRSAAHIGATNMLQGTTGNTEFGDLLEEFGDKMDASISRAAAFGDTSMMGQYRTMLDMGYAKILPDVADREYSYEGPEDEKNREFCADLLDADDTYTRANIDGMSNDEGGDVFLECGGTNCRHIWGLIAAENAGDDGGEEEDDGEEREAA